MSLVIYYRQNGVFILHLFAPPTIFASVLIRLPDTDILLCAHKKAVEAAATGLKHQMEPQRIYKYKKAPFI